MEAREGITTLPILEIFPLPIPPKATAPPSCVFRSRNIGHSPSCVITHKHPLSRYQLKPWPFPTKDICNRHYLRFWYPYLFRSNIVSTFRHLFLLMGASELGVSKFTIKVIFLKQIVTWRKLFPFQGLDQTYHEDVDEISKEW